MDLDVGVAVKLIRFLQGLETAEVVKLAGPALAILGTGALAFYKQGKASGHGTVLEQDKLIERLKFEHDHSRTELERLRPAHDRLGERAHELTEEVLRLRAAVDARSGTGADRDLIKLLQQRVDKFDTLKNALLGSEDEVWKLVAPAMPVDFERRMMASRAKIFTVANLKGGVGKTTLTANLAAYFSLGRKKRVLLIDFDYQGSLTRMVVLGAQLPFGQAILADTLLGGDASGSWLAQAARELGPRVGNIRLISCGPTFDGFENRALLRWLIGEIEHDIRYRLANIVLSEPVQSNFDLILIDAPPRLSLGTVNALCASHGILLPTVPDVLSVDATNRFITRANLFRQLNPALRLTGIVTSMSEETALKNFEATAMNDAKLALANWSGNPGLVFKQNIRHFTSLARAAGKSIGYIDDKAVRTVFDELGREISEAWQL